MCKAVQRRHATRTGDWNGESGQALQATAEARLAGNSAIMIVELVFALALAWLMLGQAVAPVQVVGALIIVAVVMVFGLWRGKYMPLTCRSLDRKRLPDCPRFPGLPSPSAPG